MAIKRFPLWLRIILEVLKALIQVKPPKNGELDDDNEASK